MSVLHWLNFASITIIGGLACWFTYFISGAKYRFYKAVMRAVFKFDFWYLKWYWHNRVYLWCISARLMLICTNLYLITMFSENSIFQKRLFIFIVSPLLWISIFGVIVLLSVVYNKTKEIESRD